MRVNRVVSYALNNITNLETKRPAPPTRSVDYLEKYTVGTIRTNQTHPAPILVLTLLISRARNQLRTQVEYNELINNHSVI